MGSKDRKSETNCYVEHICFPQTKVRGQNNMKTITHPLAIVLFIIASTLVSPAFGQEQSLKKRNVPKPVLEAFSKAYPNATIKGFAKEIEKGVVEYEVESVEGKIHRDISYGSDGSVIVVEESMDFKDLPEPVRNAVTKNHPKAKITVCEKVTEASVVRYELLLKTGKKKTELVFNADGTLEKKEKK
jgi:hypothetical protein